jgi:dTDP-4-amino-4,6-dideoxygalactose transaminase
VKAGDHVVTSPFTFFASAGAIAWIGARPLLADVELETALLDPAAARAAVDGRTTCLLPVHLYGQLVDMRAFRALADEKKLALLEDGAQCHGAVRDGVRCGELGDAAAFSFYPTKNLGACGEGGMILTRRTDVHARAKRLREHGSAQRYQHAEIGTNSRLQGLQGAALNVKLPHLERWNARRRAIAARYDQAFAGARELALVRAAPGSTHVYHQYAIRITGEVGRDARDRAAEAGADRRGGALPHAGAPAGGRAPLGLRAGRLPECRAAGARGAVPARAPLPERRRRRARGRARAGGGAGAGLETRGLESASGPAARACRPGPPQSIRAGRCSCRRTARSRYSRRPHSCP